MRATRILHHFTRRLAALGLASLAAGAWAAAPVLPDSPEGWRAAAQADIEAAVQVTRENHPGARDPHNPGFLAKLDAARRHGLALAAKVNDAAGYSAAVEGFNVRIGDGHAGIRVSIDKSARPPTRWPGFITVWRGEALYVHSSQDGQLAVGSKLLGCDGRTGEQLVRENVFSFEGRVAEAGQWWTAAPNLFINTHNPFVMLPQRCRFESGGTVREHTLAWRELDAEGRRQRIESESGDARPVGMFEARKNLAWVSMPTFHPNEEERAAYRALTRDVETKRSRWLAFDAVVIDLRKNGGGSSAWSVDFARALWGSERVRQARAAFSGKTEVWWRASPDNTDYVFSLVQLLAGQGSQDMAAWARRNAEGMRAALARGDDFHVEKQDSAAAAPDTPDTTAPFTRPVYVVVPGNCASACLDALDVFTRFPNTTLIGAPSSADSTYMEVRRHPLASGLAVVIVPNKMYVNRGRANGQIYPAAIEVRDVNWSIDSLLRTVEADLARRK
jgi:hypothetical protein